MSKWFSKLYEPVMAPLEKIKFNKVRKYLIHQAEGQVLEIGSGTGMNFPFYEGAHQADDVTAIEPNPEMVKKSLPKTKNNHVAIHVHLGSAEDLPYSDNRFDTIVGTLVFCTIPDPEKAFREIKRVLKPNGKLLLFEHIRLNHALLGKIQDLLAPVWKRICDGCYLNRNTLQMAKTSGFQVVEEKSFYKGVFLAAKLTRSD